MKFLIGGLFKRKNKKFSVRSRNNKIIFGNKKIFKKEKLFMSDTNSLASSEAHVSPPIAQHFPAQSKLPGVSLPNSSTATGSPGSTSRTLPRPASLLSQHSMDDCEDD